MKTADKIPPHPAYKKKGRGSNKNRQLFLKKCPRIIECPTSLKNINEVSLQTLKAGWGLAEYLTVVLNEPMGNDYQERRIIVSNFLAEHITWG